MSDWGALLYGVAVGLWLGSAVKGVAVVSRAVEDLYVQKGKEAGDACTELVTSSWLFVDVLKVVLS